MVAGRWALALCRFTGRAFGAARTTRCSPTLPQARTVGRRKHGNLRAYVHAVVVGRIALIFVVGQATGLGVFGAGIRCDNEGSPLTMHTVAQLRVPSTVETVRDVFLTTLFQNSRLSNLLRVHHATD